MATQDLPAWLTRWAAISWRLIVIGAVVFFGFRALRTVSVVILSVVVALFLTAVLWGPTNWLEERRVPRGLSSFLSVAGAVGVLTLVGLFVIPQFVASFDTIGSDLSRAWDSLEDWLINGPLGLTAEELDGYRESFVEWIQGVGQDSIVGGATAVLEFLTGAVLALVVTFFLLKDGHRLLAGLRQRLAPDHAQKTATAVSVARKSLAQYMGGIALVGLFDATLIAIALWIVGAPLVLPLAILVFLGAYIPLVGAFVSGLLAVAVTFVNGGLGSALIVLVVVIAVQQFEGDVIMPIVFGQTLKLHPLVILLGIAVGGLAFGLFGAFLSVPLIAVAVAVNDAISDHPDQDLISLARG